MLEKSIVMPGQPVMSLSVMQTTTGVSIRPHLLSVQRGKSILQTKTIDGVGFWGSCRSGMHFALKKPWVAQRTICSARSNVFKTIFSSCWRVNQRLWAVDPPAQHISLTDFPWISYGIEIEFSHLSVEQTTQVLQVALQGRQDWWMNLLGYHCVLDRLGQRWHIKPDGPGLTEINTPVWRSQEALQQLKPVLLALHKAGAKLPQDAGLHIHVSGTYLRPFHVAHLLVLNYQHYTSLLEVLKVHAIREHFCPNWSILTLTQLLIEQPIHRIGLLDVLMNEHRVRHGLNVGNLRNIGQGKETIEFRYFNSTLDWQLVAKYTWFVQAIVWYAMQQETYPYPSALAERSRFSQVLERYFADVGNSPVDQSCRIYRMSWIPKSGLAQVSPGELAEESIVSPQPLRNRLNWYDISDFP